MPKWTLSQYIDALREKIDEVGSTDYFKNEELTRYLNAAINDMATELQIEDSKTLTGLVDVTSIDYKEIFVSTSEKTKPIQDRNHNFLQVRSVYVNNKRIPLGTLEDREKGLDVAYLWGEKIRFVIPKTGDVEVFYYRKPRTLVNTTDTTDVPERFQHVPLEFAMAECRRKDEEEGQYNNIMNSYREKKAEMEYEIASKESEGNDRIIFIEGIEG